MRRFSERIILLDAPLNTYSFNETVERIREAISNKRVTQQVSMNVAKLVKMRSDSLLREDVLASDIVSADGVGIVWGCRILGLGNIERVAGIDLMIAVLEMCAEQGYAVYFLGATDEVLAKVNKVVPAKWPGLRIAGMRNGYFDPNDEPNIVQEIQKALPDCLFIAMPTPRKERFLAHYRSALNVPFTMGVGGSLDVMVGKVSRAPIWMQRHGLEWLHRVLQEPRRMWWRYTSSNAAFAFLMVSSILSSFKAKFSGRGHAN